MTQKQYRGIEDRVVLKLDEQGRLRIPADMRMAAGIGEMDRSWFGLSRDTSMWWMPMLLRARPKKLLDDICAMARAYRRA